ncbi:MAG: ketoacyl-ACP synthase III [Deltaproteobacteria bacterium]|nr:ketoacyl-ACP synthase III [Deltaproteobacteria bacterium]
MPHARIVGTGSSIPQRVLTNRELEDIVDTSDEWITRRTGIKERHISFNGKSETTTALSTEASQRALEMAGIEPETIDMIVAGTVTPDRQIPALACMVQQAIGADNATAFDISAGCSGFLYALDTVNNAIRLGSCKNALVIGAERLSSILNWKDRGTCVLLGDGAGAVAVSATEEMEGVLSAHLRSDGRFWDLLYSAEGNGFIPGILEGIEHKSFHLVMNGNQLFKKAVACLADIAREALDKNGMTREDLSFLVPHQANIRIIQAMARSLGMPMERVYTNVHKYGNTSSASIPIALDEANREGFLKMGDRLLLLAFGAGLTWGASMIRWTI